MFHSVSGNRIAALLFSALAVACGGGNADPAFTSGESNNLQGSSASGAAATTEETTAASFNRPIGVAADANGSLYVADAGNYTIRRITADGKVSTLAGTPGVSGSADGSGTAAQFSDLHGITVDTAGNIYAVDNSAIRKITPAGLVTTLAGMPGVTGHANDTGAAARFNQPWGIAVDAAGNLYVGDTQNYAVRRVTPTGVVSTLAGAPDRRGTVDGSIATASFLGPRGVAIDAAGNLYVTDWFGPPAPNIPEGSTFVRKIGIDGTVGTLAGSLGGETGPAQFMDTSAITAAADGTVYVAAMRSVHRVSSGGAVNVLAGPDMQFESLEGIAIDAAGDLYVTDAAVHVVSKVTQEGAITPVAGTPGEPGSDDSSTN